LFEFITTNEIKWLQIYKKNFD